MPLILGTNSIKDTGYNVDNSLRFNSGSSDDLNITPGSAGNRRTWTWSAWVKRSILGGEQNLLASTNNNRICFETVDSADQFALTDTNTSTIDVVTNQVFRDVSAWYHLVVAFDSTQGTAANRVKLYVNGSQVTSLARSTYPAEDAEFSINNTSAQYIGRNSGGSNYFNGYMSEVVFIDGQQLAADQFGEFDSDSGIWKPIDVSGLTFGNNGFYLEFKQSGTSQNSSGLGADTSGEDNHLAVNNLTALDQSTDTCTNNFATLNPLSSAVTLSEGNLQFSGTYNAKSTFAVSSGKWYLECKVTNNNTYNPMLGFAQVGSANIDNPAGDGYAGDTPNSYHFQRDGKIYANGSSTPTQTGLATIAQNDIVGLALDLDSGTKTVKWYKNGSSIATQNISETASEPYIFWTYASGSQAGEGQVNFGGTNTYSISSGNTDGNGFGNFEFAPPSGYFALCTKNLAEYG